MENVQNTSMDPSRDRKVKHANDPLRGIMMGVILIFTGIFIFLESQDLFFGDSFWWIALSAGVVFLVEAGIKMRQPAVYKSFTGPLVWGSILTIFGACNIWNLENMWPLLLVVFGAVLVLRSRRQFTQKTA